MTEQANTTELVAVHQCKHRGHVADRGRSSTLALISGVFECPECGGAGALNVVVMNAEKLSETTTVG